MTALPPAAKQDSREEVSLEFADMSLETPALTKAQLSELLFEQIGLN